MINREQAVTLIKKYLKDADNVRFAVAVEHILKKIAELSERDQELWSITGLLHNIDYEYCAYTPEQRGTLSSQLLDGLLPEEGVNAIKANNYMHLDYIPTTSLDKCLIAAVSSAELIIKIAKNTDSKKISDVDLPLIITKFNDTCFAPKINRNRIAVCEDFGMQIESFLEICLDSLKELSQDIGL
jgi:uncharacterized protein